MLAPALLVLTLVTGQELRAANAQEEPFEEEGGMGDRDDTGPYLVGWGGEAWDAAGGFSTSVFGAEAGYSFSALDLGVAGYGYKNLFKDGETSTVILGRIGERFVSHRGLEGYLAFGFGSARNVNHWTGWFQVALGFRLLAGPLFVSGEVTFEQQNLIRLGAGLGVRF